MSRSRDVLYSSNLFGRLPGAKKDSWSLFYVEVTSGQMHIFEGHNDLTKSRKHLRSLEIGGTDKVGEDKGGKKKEHRFYIDRGVDGKYVFKTDGPEERQIWIMQLERVITCSSPTHNQPSDFGTPSSTSAFDPTNMGKPPPTPKHYDVPSPPTSPPSSHYPPPHHRPPRSATEKSIVAMPLPPAPSQPGLKRRNSREVNRASMASTDSGIGPSMDGVMAPRTRTGRSGSSSVPSSGDGTFRHQVVITPKRSRDSKSDSARFNVRQAVQLTNPAEEEEELDNYTWYWGVINRQDCEENLKEEGEIGNFIVRVNDKGQFAMSLLRSDGVHHHRIVQSDEDNKFRFYRAAVNVEGDTLVDLLDTYIKSISDTTVKPLGGSLHLVYEDPWNPPPLDMAKLAKKLQEQKRRDRQRGTQPPPSQQQGATSEHHMYRPIEIDLATGPRIEAQAAVPMPHQLKSRDHPATASKKKVPPPLPPKTSPQDSGSGDSREFSMGATSAEARDESPQAAHAPRSKTLGSPVQRQEQPGVRGDSNCDLTASLPPPPTSARPRTAPPPSSSHTPPIARKPLQLSPSRDRSANAAEKPSTAPPPDAATWTPFPTKTPPLTSAKPPTLSKPPTLAKPVQRRSDVTTRSASKTDSRYKDLPPIPQPASAPLAESSSHGSFPQRPPSPGYPPEDEPEMLYQNMAQARQGQRENGRGHESEVQTRGAACGRGHVAETRPNGAAYENFTLGPVPVQSYTNVDFTDTLPAGSEEEGGGMYMNVDRQQQQGLRQHRQPPVPSQPRRHHNHVNGGSVQASSGGRHPNVGTPRR